MKLKKNNNPKEKVRNYLIYHNTKTRNTLRINLPRRSVN